MNDDKQVMVIDWAILQYNGFTPSQYAYIYLLATKQEEKADYFCRLTLSDYDFLINNDWLTIDTNGNHVCTTKTTDYFKKKEAIYDIYFNELFNAYPRNVPGRDGGLRALRGTDPYSDTYADTRKKYVKILKKNNIHATVMKSLETELKLRKDKTFMNNFKTYINQQGWVMYDGVQETKPNIRSTQV